MGSNRNGLTGLKQNHYEEQSHTSLFDNPLWDIRKTSLMLSVAEKTLRDWVYKRQIPFKKVGHLVRFNPSEINVWIQERTKHGY